MVYTLVIDAPHGESGGTMLRKIQTHSVTEVAQNLFAVSSENPGVEIVCKITAEENPE